MSKNKVFVIDGNRFERNNFMTQMKNAMGPHEVFLFDDEYSVDSVTQFITEINVFNQNHRLFIINRLPYYKSKDENRSETRVSVIAGFIRVLPIIPDGNTVVFNNLGIGVKKFLDTAKENGEVKEFDQKFTIDTAKSKIISYLGKRGKTIHQDDAAIVANLLSDDAGKVDIDVLRLSLLKMDHFIGTRTKVLREDVFLIFENLEKFVIWNLYNFLDLKKYGESTRVIENKFRSSNDEMGCAIEMVYSMLWRYAALLCVKCSQEIREKPDKIIADTISMIKLKRSGKYYNIVMSPLSKKDKDGIDIPGEESHIYNEKTIQEFMEGRHRGKPVMEEYNFVHLCLVYYALVQLWSKIRTGCQDSERRSLFQIVLSLICGEIKSRPLLSVMDIPQIQILKNFELGAKKVYD